MKNKRQKAHLSMLKKALILDLKETMNSIKFGRESETF